MSEDKIVRMYGSPGSPIQGTKLVRDYCSLCGTPIRVIAANGSQTCIMCDVERDTKSLGTGNDDVEAADKQFHGGRFYSGEW